MRRLAAKHPGLRLVVVADRSIGLPGVAVEYRRWTLDQELTCFAGLAVGLMPLEDSPWSRAKCAFKAIQYMALGIPAVVSPVGMNTEVVEDGVNGLLAADDDGWYRALDALLTNRSLAARIGAEGRKTVERDYGLNGASRALVGLFADVLAGSAAWTATT